MTVKLVLKGFLKDKYLSGKKESIICNIEKGFKIVDLLKKYDINSKFIAIVSLNNQVSDLKKSLNDGDIIELYPPIGGG
jgi:sulfur carrier protein ThiS